MWSQSTNVTDRQTTCDRNTALCTKVHRAVKNEKMSGPLAGIFFWLTLYIVSVLETFVCKLLVHITRVSVTLVRIYKLFVVLPFYSWTSIASDHGTMYFILQHIRGCWWLRESVCVGISTSVICSVKLINLQLLTLAWVYSSPHPSVAVSFEQGSRLLFSGWPFTDFFSENYWRDWTDLNWTDSL